MDLKNINIDLKNINLEDIKSKLLAIDKKTYIKFGIGAGSIIFFLIIYYAILNPIVNKKKIQLDDMQTKQQEIVTFDQEINSAKPEYKNYSTLFHSKSEVEGLYETLSEFAYENGLTLSKISKGKPKPVLKSQILKSEEKDAEAKTKKANIAYYKIPVKFEIKGNFLGYIKFKRAVSLSRKMLNFDNETIKVVQGDATNTIIASGTLTIVGLPDEFL